MAKKTSPQAETIKKDLKKYAALEAVALSEGGKILVDNLVVDILAGLDRLGSMYKGSTLDQLLPVIADIDNKRDILRVIIRSKKNKQLAYDALADELKRVEEEDEG